MLRFKAMYSFFQIVVSVSGCSILLFLVMMFCGYDSKHNVILTNAQLGFNCTVRFPVSFERVVAKLKIVNLDVRA